MYLLRLWLLISTYNQTIVRILEWKVKSNDNSILLSSAQHVICNMRQKLDLSQDFTLNNSDSNLNTEVRDDSLHSLQPGKITLNDGRVSDFYSNLTTFKSWMDMFKLLLYV